MSDKRKKREVVDTGERLQTKITSVNVENKCPKCGSSNVKAFLYTLPFNVVGNTKTYEIVCMDCDYVISSS